MYDEYKHSSGTTILFVAMVIFIMGTIVVLYHFGKSRIDGAWELQQKAEVVSEAAHKGKGSAKQAEQTSGTVYDVTVPRTDNFSVIDANGNSQVIFEDQVTFNIYNK